MSRSVQLVLAFFGLVVLTGLWLWGIDPGGLLYMAFECIDVADATSVCRGIEKTRFAFIATFGGMGGLGIFGVLWGSWFEKIAELGKKTLVARYTRASS